MIEYFPITTDTPDLSHVYLKCRGKKSDILIYCFLKFFILLIGITPFKKRDQNLNKKMMNTVATV